MTRAELEVEAWNFSHPVGTRVLVKRDRGEVLETVTRSEAWALGGSGRRPGHTAVVMVEGIAGAYLLDRVTAFPSPKVSA